MAMRPGRLPKPARFWERPRAPPPVRARHDRVAADPAGVGETENQRVRHHLPLGHRPLGTAAPTQMRMHQVSDHRPGILGLLGVTDHPRQRHGAWVDHHLAILGRHHQATCLATIRTQEIGHLGINTGPNHHPIHIMDMGHRHNLLGIRRLHTKDHRKAAAKAGTEATSLLSAMRRVVRRWW